MVSGIRIRQIKLSILIIICISLISIILPPIEALTHIDVGETNPPKTHYCVKCSAVLDMAKAYEHQRVHEEADALFINLFKVMVDKGMIDEAVQAIHDAGMGMRLKRM